METIVDTLCNNMVSDKEQLRDISSIALKTVINELPPGASVQATSVCRRIIVQLCRAISMVSLGRLGRSGGQSSSSSCPGCRMLVHLVSACSMVT